MAILNGAQNASLAPSPERTPVSSRKLSHETSLLNVFPSIDDGDEMKAEMEEEKDDESHFDASTIASSHRPGTRASNRPSPKQSTPTAANAVAVAVDSTVGGDVNLVTLTPVGTFSPTGAGVVYVAETVPSRGDMRLSSGGSGYRPNLSSRSMDANAFTASGGRQSTGRPGAIDSANESFYGPIHTNYNSSSFYQIPGGPMSRINTPTGAAGGFFPTPNMSPVNLSGNMTPTNRMRSSSSGRRVHEENELMERAIQESLSYATYRSQRVSCVRYLHCFQLCFLTFYVFNDSPTMKMFADKKLSVRMMKHCVQQFKNLCVPVTILLERSEHLLSHQL